MARQIVRDYHDAEDNLSDVFDVIDQDIRRRRIRGCGLRRIAYSLADKAYLQYGYRSDSEANRLITRKFMRDHIGQFEDIRDKDAAQAIDIALELSFLPSEAWKQMAAITRTPVYQAALHPTGLIGQLTSIFGGRAAVG